MIQVSSGILRGVPLSSPAGKQTRPSSERLRQGTFNVLRHYRWSNGGILDSAVVIDLFAGTGAWAIEALSNGAGEIWCVESHRTALHTLHKNLDIAMRSFEAQGLEPPRIQVLKRDVAESYKKLPVARIVFCDPPYESGWFEKALRFESQYGRVEPGGVLLYEAGVKEDVPETASDLRLFDTKIYGDSAVHFFVKQSS